jgi:hypothetical protein
MSMHGVSKVDPAEYQERQDAQRQVPRRVDLDLVWQETRHVGVRPMRQVEKVRIRRRRDEGEELESRSTDTHGHRKCFERDLPNAIWMPVIAIVVIVTAARTSGYQLVEFHPLSIILGLPVDDARLDIVQQEPRCLASQQVLVPDPSALQDPTSFSQRTT